jgi:orotidine-5'-phosphate decarboxylase
MQPHERIIVALDVSDPAKASALVRVLEPHVGVFKIGFEFMMMVLRTVFSNALGLEYIRRLEEVRALSRSFKGKAFLDAKFHDIPNTVASAVGGITPVRLKMVNVHCSGGAEMMKAAKRASVESAQRAGLEPPLVLGVTLLTSLGYEDLTEIGFVEHEIDADDPEEMERLIRETFEEIAIRKLARLAEDCGLDGVICSPREIASVRRYCGPEFKVVTPGIRPSGSPPDDQKRTMTQYEAIMEGADYLVIGRPITKADDPVEAAKRIADEIAQGLKDKEGA